MKIFKLEQTKSETKTQINKRTEFVHEFARRMILLARCVMGPKRWICAKYFGIPLRIRATDTASIIAEKYRRKRNVIIVRRREKENINPSPS